MNDKIKCGVCGTLNPPGANFCENCGVRLKKPEFVPVVPPPQEKKKLNKKQITGIIYAVLLLFIVLFIANARRQASAEKAAREAEEARKSNPASYTATPESMTELLQNTSKSEPENISVNVDPDTGECKVIFTGRSDVWDETALIREELTGYINFCRIAYAADGITDVSFYIRREMTDAHGNAEDEFVVKIGMKKDAFLAYNWDNMKYKSNSFPQIKDDCDLFNVHAGIMRKVDESKVFYMG